MSKKGERNPHTPEWEAKRITAVRVALANRIYSKGYHRPPEHTLAMLKARQLAQQQDPDKFRKISIANLPKDCKGEKNGNWKGGKTKLARAYHKANIVVLKKWREAVLCYYGNKCANCGATEQLDAHHIIPLALTKEFALTEMNGVALCRVCHSHTESYANPRQRHTDISGNVTIWEVIPHRWQRYATAGNWFRRGEVLAVFVSRMNNETYEYLVALHETIEAQICLHQGISEDDVTAFDIAYEETRRLGLPPHCGCHLHCDEPGDDLHAPYRVAHSAASKCERIIALALGVDWIKYVESVMAL